MTREEAIDLLDNLIGFIEDSRNSDYDTAFRMGIKALEQEPILDKIRAEIEESAFNDVNGSKFIFVNRVNQIIDKYKAESEE